MATKQGQAVLVATLGESPVVVSATANLLLHQGMELDRVQIVYPDELDEHEKRWVGIGYDFLDAYFRQHLAIEPEQVPLPFADAHTYEHSLAFLRCMCDVLEAHTHEGNRVYLSLSGGRKHTSALMAVLPQFYACVQGLYHLHDSEEDNPRKQFSTRDLLNDMSPDERMRRLAVPTPRHLEQGRFTLIDLPFHPMSSGPLLRQWVVRTDSGDVPPPVPIPPESVSFFEDLFQPMKDTPRLDLWLTHTAYDQYCDMVATGSSRRAVIDAYLNDMTRADWHRAQRIHDQERDPNPDHLQEGSGTPLNHFTSKKARTAERVFYYTQPNAIIGYPKQAVDRLVITRFPLHINKKQYDMALVDWVQQPDIVPRYRVADLPKRPMVLLAPLGESPMVVTQTYRLLQAQGHADIAAIFIIYPGQHPPSRNGADMLEAVCRKRSVVLHRTALPIADVQNTETAGVFASGLMALIQEARSRYPQASLALSLSGGRKGMSALVFYAAQHEGVGAVYHTTIRDPDVEQVIARRFDDVRGKPVDVQAELFFLDSESLSDFVLVPVPVIPLCTT